MKKESNNNQLNNYLLNLTIVDYREKRNMIIKECKISEQVYHNWLSGRTKIPAICREKINQVCNTIIFD